MRRTLALVTTAALLAGTAIPGAAFARDRSDRTELTAGQMADHAAARAAQMKADLRLTAEQEKNWPAFETAVVDMWKNQAAQQIAWRNAQAKQPASVDLIDQMRKLNCPAPRLLEGRRWREALEVSKKERIRL